MRCSLDGVPRAISSLLYGAVLLPNTKTRQLGRLLPQIPKKGTKKKQTSEEPQQLGYKRYFSREAHKDRPYCYCRCRIHRG